MSIDEQPMNVYWSGKRTETSNNFKTNYKGSVATKNNLPSLSNKTGDMYNVAESGENFIWNGSSWDSLSGDTLKILNWQKSEKASSVAIYPVPETVLHPVVEFVFTEINPAEGDKSSDNPSTITGVSSITVTRCETVGVDSTDYVIDLGGTFYGGSVNLSAGTMTVNSQKVLLDASCSFGYYPSASTDSLAAVVVQINSLPVANGVFVTGRCACNKFPIHAKIDGEESIGFTSPTYSFSSKQIRAYLKWTTLGVSSSASSQEIIAAAKAWFTENPVELIVTYEGYSSTASISPLQIYSLSQPDKYTPRINTVYSDQTSVQVGYVKSPIRSEYELAQAIAAIEGSE